MSWSGRRMPCLTEGWLVMESRTSKLVLVAHPGDETLAFSSVCVGADIVSVTQGGWQGDAAAFRGACAPYSRAPRSRPSS
jgi:hypothetical protein